VAVLQPEKRFYPVQGMVTTEAAIHTSLVADLYVVLGDAGQAESGGGGGTPEFLRESNPDAPWTVRIYYNPLVPWIWGGCIIMVLGGIVSLSDRRLRIGAPARARSLAPQAASGD
jgi:cytochrome c-type biogenesis protein CcmF